jgi:tetratricopeptide (TPR) repeat protein
MLAIKKLLPRAGGCGALLLCLLFAGGCTPPGPRALLKGARLTREGKYPQAVQELEKARRYLERDPRVWNWLGLAYQGAGDAPRAIEAYQKALALDRSNLVFVAHYNLGCLYLQQTNPAAAVNELRSYCLLSNSLPAWLALGQAELRSRQLDAAERTFSTALRMRSGDPAACNGLGLLYAQRNRAREAAQFFQSALRSDPKYGPALLNLAVLYHQQPAQRAYAAQKYHDYLALQPRPENYDAVKAISEQLDRDLAPPPPAATNFTLLTSAPGQTNVPPTNAAPKVTNLVQAVPAPVVTQKLAQAAVTNLSKPPTNPPRPVIVVTNTIPRPAPPVTPPVVARTNAPPPSPPPARPIATSAPPTAVTVVKLPEAAPAKKAQDVAPPAPSGPSVAPPNQIAASTGNVWVVSAPAPKPAKTGFFQKLNPFGGKSKAARASAPTNSSEVLRTAPPTIPAAQEPSGAISSNPPASAGRAPAPRVDFPRYAYLAPVKPQPGDRKAAEPLFAEGFKAQQEKHPAEAVKAYRAALDKDPAYYEAYYNQSLLALQIGDGKAALQACENALALNPVDSATRMNFATALEQANYPLDAANELEKVIQAKPDEVRAHLLLANVCAQKLDEPTRARVHYLKVLELEPRHPRADEIRYWLAANP